jgi:hypothetical protein
MASAWMRAHLLFRRERRLRRAIFDELHGAHQSLAANVANVLMLGEV